MDNSTIKSIHDDDLVEFLKKLKVYDDVVSGKVKCKFTNQIITLENLHSLFPESGAIKFVSDSPEAIKEFSIYLNKKRHGGTN